MFRTEVTIPPAAEKIRHSHHNLALGSCFASLVGNRLVNNKFITQVNPLGITYNPVSLHSMIDMALAGTVPDPDRVCKLHSRFTHFDFHSEISETEPESLLVKLCSQLAELKMCLLEADWLFLTYGTSVVHTFNNQVVANCHKQPAGIFTKRMASLDEIHEAVSNSLTALQKLNPNVKVIMTVSPIRHLKDSLPVNSLSKSTLRVLVDQLTMDFDFVSYFPSYELMMDDLRDYRFYAGDMIHPSEVAEDYIWNKFSESYFDQPTRDLLKDWGQIKKNLSHRPFDPGSAEYHVFLQKTLDKLCDLSAILPVSSEIEEVKQLLNHA